MYVLTWGLTLPLAAFLIQLAWWRIRLPGRQTRAMALLFSGVAVAGVPAIALLAPPALVPSTPWGWLSVLLLHFALVMAWIITYSAFEAESPTLVMAERLLEAGKAGLDEAELTASMSDEVLLIPRVEDLERDGLAERDEAGRYRILPKGRAMLGLVYGWRRILGISGTGEAEEVRGG